MINFLIVMGIILIVWFLVGYSFGNAVNKSEK